VAFPPPAISGGVGDQYTFIALDATGKGIVSYRVGKRNQANAQAFLFDVRERALGRLISTDGWVPYEGPIEDAFGIECSYGQIVKQYGRRASNRRRPPLLAGLRSSGTAPRRRRRSAKSTARHALASANEGFHHLQG
jgi:hypothetical protein